MTRGPEKMRCLGLLIACLAGLPAAAQEVQDCDWQASAANIAEPWDANTRTFANGAVRLALLDTVEPAAGWARLLILSPPLDELGGRQCRVVGLDGMGFAGMDFSALAATYDPATGLRFSLPVQVMAGDGFEQRLLEITLDQSTGTIRPEITW